MAATCPSDNTQATDQGSFWGNGAGWDAHKVGWTIAGACAIVTVLISTITVLLHCRNYTNRREQRQIIRILYMPPIYAVISFLSYRFFRSYTYYSLAEVTYEAVTISAFLLLLIEYVAATAVGHSAENAIQRKDKRKLPIPFCCWRYRPTKPYFMYTVKWAVMQYVVLRPAVSIAGIVCQVYGVLCESIGFGINAIHFANIYLEAIDFVSITLALYGLLLFYGLVHQELEGRRPLAKFLAIKLIVMATFYQSFVFNALEGRVIKPSQFWTATNIADGLNALTICVEMVFFSIFMWWAYSPNEYKVAGAKKTSIWRPLWDSVNYWDFVLEIFGSLRFFFNYMRGKPLTHSSAMGQDGQPNMNFGQAFGVGPAYGNKLPLDRTNRSTTKLAVDTRPSYDEDIRLAPYHYGSPTHKRGKSRDSSPPPDHYGYAQ